MIRKPIVLASSKKLARSVKRVDTVSVSQKELFKIRYPHLARQPFEKLSEWKEFLSSLKGKDQWVYWPSENVAVRMFSEDLYYELRTARNRVLIPSEEQSAYRNAKVGICGLSVGSSVLSALVVSGGPKIIKIAEMDTLEPTNLNRIRAGVPDVGSKKIELAAESVWRIDPFADLKLYPEGVTEKNIEDFVCGHPRLDIAIDEMDNLSMKVALRIMARRERIPVLMATDYGDSVLLDVERFDLEPKRKIFHGLAGNLTVAGLRGITGKGWLKIVDKIIGGSYMPPRHRAAISEVGKTLDGVSRLGTDGMLTGASVSLAVRKIVSGESLPSGRYMLNLNKVLSQRIIK